MIFLGLKLPYEEIVQTFEQHGMFCFAVVNFKLSLCLIASEILTRIKSVCPTISDTPPFILCFLTLFLSLSPQSQPRQYSSTSVAQVAVNPAQFEVPLLHTP